VTVIEVSELVMIVAELLPNFTEVTPVKATPLIMTWLPPKDWPEFGASPVMEGGGMT
jgi:hypothetical protein